MSNINLNIDGIEISAFKGMTILQAAQENNIQIPNLCNHNKLHMYGSCGLCVVEVESFPRPVRACATEISEGMVIKTWSPKLHESRKTSLELMFSNHGGDCKAPCSQGCPANVDVQGYVGLIANGEYGEAIKLIKENLPLPASIGRVCPHPCQTACNRNLLDEAISIAWLKYFAADMDLASDKPYMPEIAPETGKSIAVIGGGPSGLSAAYFLRTKGHEVKVYEAMPEFGGMLKYGIPLYRLPKETLKAEVEVIRNMGVRLIPNIRIGKDIQFEHIRKNHDAVYVAVGAWKSSGLGCPGSDLDGVFGGIEFLNKFAVNEPIKTGKRIAVVGGGNTAMDACRTSIRLGAEKVYCVYRRTKEDMPAVDTEIIEAEEEQIDFKFLLNPVEILDEGTGKVKRVKLQKMKVTGESGGRRKVEPIENEFEYIEVDSVIVAIGQAIDNSGLEEIETNKWGNIAVDLETLQTSIPGVFAGGDGADDGATIAIDAINDGKNAAKVIDSYLNGKILPIKKPMYSKRENLTAENFSKFKTQPRTHMGHEDPKIRMHNFEEVLKGFTETETLTEANRCLECGCMDYFECKLIKLGMEYDANPKAFLSEKPTYDIVEENPFITRDSNKCILCGMCIRTCEEVMDVGILGFDKRGYDTCAKPAFKKKMQETDCIACGQCIHVCPTGALGEKHYLDKPVPLNCDRTPTVCAACGIGCNVDVETKGGRVVRTLPLVKNNSQGDIANDAVLCSRGRFGYGFDKSARITKPLIRKGGVLVETTMEDALMHIGKKSQSINLMYGKNSMAISVSDRMTNEDAWMLNKLGKGLLETEHVFTFNQNNNGLKDVLRVDASLNLIDELANSELTLLVGTNIFEDHTIAGLNVKKAVDKGKTLIVLNSKPSRVDRYAKLCYNNLKDLSLLKEITLYLAQNYKTARKRVANVNDGKIEEIVKALGTVKISPEAEEIAKLYLASTKALIVFDNSNVNQEASRLIAYMALVSGHIGSAKDGIIVMRPNANSQGILDMGIRPTSDEVKKDIEAGKIKGMMIFGEDIDKKELKLIREKCDFLVVQDVIMTEAAKAADVVLPQALPIEDEGTYTSTERKIQKLQSIVRKSVEMSNWEIIQHLMNTYSTNSSFTKPEEITADIIQNLKQYNPARNLLGGENSYYWTTGKSRILFEGSVNVGIEFKVLAVKKPGFETHENTDIIGKMFAKKLGK